MTDTPTAIVPATGQVLDTLPAAAPIDGVLRSKTYNLPDNVGTIVLAELPRGLSITINCNEYRGVETPLYVVSDCLDKLPLGFGGSDDGIKEVMFYSRGNFDENGVNPHGNTYPSFEQLDGLIESAIPTILPALSRRAAIALRRDVEVEVVHIPEDGKVKEGAPVLLSSVLAQRRL